MIYVLAGAPRSGKTLLARRAVAEKQLPYIPLDSLFVALANGAPQLGVTYDDFLTERPLKMWPVTKSLFKFFSEEEDDFLVEGDSILPLHIEELQKEGKPVTACFLGYAGLSKEAKLALIRKHHRGTIDWTKDLSDRQLLPMVGEMIDFSTYLQKECTERGLRYFDVSERFEETRNEAFSYLFS